MEPLVLAVLLIVKWRWIVWVGRRNKEAKSLSLDEKRVDARRQQGRQLL